MLHYVTVREVHGVTAICSDGSRPLVVGNHRVRPGEGVWTDGKVVYGDQHIRGGGGGGVLGGIPVYGDDGKTRGYINDAGQYIELPVKKGAITDTPQNVEAALADDWIDAELDGDKLLGLTSGIYDYHVYDDDILSIDNGWYEYETADMGVEINMPIFGSINVPRGDGIAYCSKWTSRVHINEVVYTGKWVNDGEWTRQESSNENTYTGKWVCKGPLNMQWRDWEQDTANKKKDTEKKDNSPRKYQDGSYTALLDLENLADTVKAAFAPAGQAIVKKLDDKSGRPWPDVQGYPDRPDVALMQVQAKVINGKIRQDGSYWYIVDAWAGGYCFPWLSFNACLWEVVDEYKQYRQDVGIGAYDVLGYHVPPEAFFDRISEEKVEITPHNFRGCDWIPIRYKVHYYYYFDLAKKNDPPTLLYTKVITEPYNLPQTTMINTPGGPLQNSYGKTVRNWFWLKRQEECVDETYDSYDIEYGSRRITYKTVENIQQEDIQLDLTDRYTAVVGVKNEQQHEIVDPDGRSITCDIKFKIDDEVCVGRTRSGIYIINVKGKELYKYDENSGLTKLLDKIDNCRVRRMHNINKARSKDKDDAGGGAN